MSTALEQAVIEAHGTGEWVRPQDVVKAMRQAQRIPKGTDKAEIHRTISALVTRGVLERKQEGAQSFHRFKGVVENALNG